MKDEEIIHSVLKLSMFLAISNMWMIQDRPPTSIGRIRIKRVKETKVTAENKLFIKAEMGFTRHEAASDELLTVFMCCSHSHQQKRTTEFKKMYNKKSLLWYFWTPE